MSLRKRVFNPIPACLAILAVSASAYGPYPGWSVIRDTHNAVALAPQGAYLWVATNGGLVKLDTATLAFTLFTTANSPLPMNGLRSVAVDGKGALWIGSDSGLTRMDGAGWTTFTRKTSGMPGNSVRALSVHTGKLWIGTDSGLAVESGGAISSLKDNAAAGGAAPVQVFAVGKDSSLWVGSTRGLSLRAPSGEWKSVSTDPQSSKQYLSLAVDSANHLWAVQEFVGSTYLEEYVGAAVLPHYTSEFDFGELRFDSFGHLAIDRHGRKWWALQSGAGYMDGSKLTVISPSDGIQFTDLKRTIFLDGLNRPWFGSSNSLLRYDGKTALRISVSQAGFSTFGVTQSLPDPDGTLWVAHQGGLGRFRNGKGQPVSDPALPAGFWAGTKRIARDSAGSWWIASDSGLVSFRGGKFRKHPMPATLGWNGRVTAMACSPKGEVWIGTEQGVFIFREPDWRAILRLEDDDIAPDMREMRISTIEIDDKDTVWIGKPSGVLRFNPARTWDYILPATNYSPRVYLDSRHRPWVMATKQFASREGFQWISLGGIPDPGYEFRAMAFDTSGTAWIGTSHGLLKYRSGKWEAFNTTNSGLPDDDIEDVAYDPAGRILVSTLYGIGIFEIAKSTAIRRGGGNNPGQTGYRAGTRTYRHPGEVRRDIRGAMVPKPRP